MTTPVEGGASALFDAVAEHAAIQHEARSRRRRADRPQRQRLETAKGRSTGKRQRITVLQFHHTATAPAAARQALLLPPARMQASAAATTWRAARGALPVVPVCTAAGFIPTFCCALGLKTWVTLTVTGFVAPVPIWVSWRLAAVARQFTVPQRVVRTTVCTSALLGAVLGVVAADGAAFAMMKAESAVARDAESAVDELERSQPAFPPEFIAAFTVPYHVPPRA